MALHRRSSVLHRCDPKQIGFLLVYVISVVFNFHTLLVAYGNSTFMEQFTGPEVVGALYIISSCIAILAFLFISRVLRKIGNVTLTIWISVAELITLLALASTNHPATAIVAFVIFLTLNPLVYMSIDIFSEKLIGNNEGSTGSKRGLALALMSLASCLAPLALSFIVGDNPENLTRIYYYAAGVQALFILLILTKFRTFEDPKYREIEILKAIHSFWIKPDLRNVFLAHLTLQFFFSWSVVYFPLYLATEIGFGWDTIGQIISVGLFAYVLFEYPIGIIADKWFGEKEMMALGFVIIAVSISWVAFMGSAPILSWMVLLFISRIGASLVEATTEIYFFKHTKGNDTDIISFFRITRPLSMVMAALAGSVLLLYLPFNLTFIVIAFCMLPGAFYAVKLKDTK